jgi:hypothetical protein
MNNSHCPFNIKEFILGDLINKPKLRENKSEHARLVRRNNIVFLHISTGNLMLYEAISSTSTTTTIPLTRTKASKQTNTRTNNKQTSKQAPTTQKPKHKTFVYKAKKLQGSFSGMKIFFSTKKKSLSPESKLVVTFFCPAKCNLEGSERSLMSPKMQFSAVTTTHCVADI